MAYWLGVVSAEAFLAESLYAHDTCPVAATRPAAATAPAAGPAPAKGDRVVLAAQLGQPVVFGTGVIDGWLDDVATVQYERRLFDEPVPLTLDGGAGLRPLDADRFAGLVGSLPPVPRSPRAEWFVSVVLPIEAASAADAVREFWTYVEQLGPRELPAFLWPRGDELAMQTYVLGAEANQDPEEDDE